MSRHGISERSADGLAADLSLCNCSMQNDWTFSGITFV